jgi:hypothetical protein
MYRDFQENTLNSDGAFAMWVAFLGLLYSLHAVYNYFLPWYWNKTGPCMNGEEQRNRMRDAIASTTFEDSSGLNYAEWAFPPHDFHSVRQRIAVGLKHPDDVRAMHVSSLNRKHRYVEHYRKNVGNDQATMIPI